jgi:CHAD domain-containing protein
MYQQARPGQNLEVYAGHVIEFLLRDLAFGIQKTLKEPTAESVHDLRRVCLRLRHAVRFFRDLLPERVAEKVRRRLGALQDLLGAVRSCDIALETLAHRLIVSAVSQRQKELLVQTISSHRRLHLRPLRLRLRRMQRADTLRRWRFRLLGAA